MNKFVFNSIKIKNFKGIANLEMDFANDKMEIVAETGSGKSSIFEAIKWVLGFNVSNFEPKIETYRIKKIITQVELSINKNDLIYTLKRTSEQKWKVVDKETGEKAYDSNQSTFEFDGLECKPKSYTAKIEDFFEMKEEELNIVLDIKSFNIDKAQKWTWVDRRKFLKEKMNIDILLENLIENPKYSLLKEDLIKGKDEIDIQKQLTQDKKIIASGDAKNKVNGLLQYNTLIDNKVSEIAELSKIDFENLENKKNTIQAEIEKIIINNNNKSSENIELDQKNNELSKLNLEISKLKNEFCQKENDYNSELITINGKINKLESEIDNLNKMIKNCNIDIEENNIDISELENEEFDKNKEYCHTCNQKLPKEQIEKLVVDFENNKKTKIDYLKLELKNSSTRLSDLKGELNIKTNDLKALKADLKALQERKPIYDYDTEKKLIQKTNVLNQEICNLKVSNVKENINDKLKELRNQQDEILKELGKKEILQKCQNELSDLKKNQKQLSNKERDRILKQNQLKNYIKEEVAIINNETSKYFHKDIKFNFFIWNGSNAENEFDMCCNILYKGVEYNNLSQGQRIICDTLFIRDLQKLLNVNFPIVVDNRQDNTFDIETTSQLIELITMKNKNILGLVPISTIYSLEDCDRKEE